jgi:uncharacterized protein YkwD
MPFNWVDLVIVAYVAYQVVGGLELGLVSLLGSLGAFFGSLLLAIRYQGQVGSFLRDKFGLAPLWTSVLGYLAVAFIAEAILAEIFRSLLSRVPKKLIESKQNRWLGGVVSAANAILVTTFVLLVLLALPLRGTIREDIRGSRIGSFLVEAAEKFAAPVTASVNKAAKGAVEFITVQPASRERIPLDVTPQSAQLSVDQVSEATMLALVNEERQKAGASVLVFDEKLSEVARAHSRDMFERRYFSHYSPEGDDASDRLDAAGVSYQYAGENLAYAPDVASAHEGFMNSEGHRANILEGRFRRVGIGIIDGGVYGKMFTQIFAD